MRLSATAALLLGLTTVAGAQTAHWSYHGKTGALEWGHLNPAWRVCEKGHEQSPIDIRGARLDTGLQPIQFHYIAGEVTVANDGNAIVVHVDPGSFIVAGGVRYNLVEFTFHHPSEHAIRGRLADMEVDFLHRGAGGKIVMLGVLFNEEMSYPNAAVAQIWAHLPTKAGASQRITDMVDPGGLFPSDRGYWTYTGSLLHPPCTENVQWYIFEQPLTVSREQLRALTAIFKMNTRPIQDPHGRKIEADE
ncbi:MAG: carbonic anhydrase [Terracidiphilus sp.]